MTRRILFKLAGALLIVGALVYASPADARTDGSNDWRPYAANAKVAADQQFDSTKGFYFTNNVLCAGQEAAIADQPLQVYASSYTLFPVNGSCSGFPAPVSKDIAVKWVLQVSSFGGPWSNCRSGSWNYAHTSFMDRSNSWNSAPCGGGKFYRTKGLAKVKFNGTWHQGSRATQGIFQGIN
jgi:hypothetical protein